MIFRVGCAVILMLLFAVAEVGKQTRIRTVVLLQPRSERETITGISVDSRGNYPRQLLKIMHTRCPAAARGNLLDTIPLSNYSWGNTVLGVIDRVDCKSERLFFSRHPNYRFVVIASCSLPIRQGVSLAV